MSRLGRNIILLTAGISRWRLFIADVKSAFLQADDQTSTAANPIDGVPNRDMQRIMG